MPLVGEDFPISAVLENQETNLFVRALLRDADDNPLPFSPIALTHRGAGLYLENKPYPDTDYVTVVYEVYEDAFFAKPAIYFAGGESFTREVETVNEIATEKIIEEINEHTTDQMSRLAFADVVAEVNTGQEISVTLGQNEVTVVVEDQGISATMDQETLSAQVEQEAEVTTEISQDEIDVKVKQDDC